MPRKTVTAKELAALITQLRQQRQEHLDAIDEIDATFRQFGISSSAKKRRGRPPRAMRGVGRMRKRVARKAGRKPTKKVRRKARRRFKITANESILRFVKAAGRKGITGAEIVKHWRSEGRGAGAYVTIGKLVKAKKLKRQKVKGAKGSRYTLV